MIRIHIGLVNNMPDSALDLTERQFRQLLEDAAKVAGESLRVQLSLFALPNVPHSDEGKRRIASHYLSIKELWNTSLDGLIVTGAEPLAANLKDEPYWLDLSRLVDWAEHNTSSAVWSCLAAHAAMQHIEGIERRPLNRKLFGVYECSKVGKHFLTSGISSKVFVPHSRWNNLREEELIAGGYQVLTRSEKAGVDTFVRSNIESSKRSHFVFFQGHPEYESASLLFEYRRDIHRFLRHQGDTYPTMPEGYLDESCIRELNAFRDRVLKDRREESLADFPVAAAAFTVRNTWRPAAIKMYANWLNFLCARKERQWKQQSRVVASK